MEHGVTLLIALFLVAVLCTENHLAWPWVVSVECSGLQMSEFKAFFFKLKMLPMRTFKRKRFDGCMSKHLKWIFCNERICWRCFLEVFPCHCLKSRLFKKEKSNPKQSLDDLNLTIFWKLKRNLVLLLNLLAYCQTDLRIVVSRSKLNLLFQWSIAIYDFMKYSIYKNCLSTGC